MMLSLEIIKYSNKSISISIRVFIDNMILIIKLFIFCLYVFYYSIVYKFFIIQLFNYS